MLDAKDMEMLAQLIDQKLDQKLEPISSRLGRLEPLNASCGICGSTKDLLFVDGIAICREHAEELARVLEKSQSSLSATGGGGTDAAR